jgi:hypothetical protein
VLVEVGVGGTLVLVGVMGVLVLVGGEDVFVLVGGSGVLVLVGGMDVSLGAGKSGVLVAVGDLGVWDGVRLGCGVKVKKVGDGVCVAVLVREIKRVGVMVDVLVGEGEGVAETAAVIVTGEVGVSVRRLFHPFTCKVTIPMQ